MFSWNDLTFICIVNPFNGFMGRSRADVVSYFYPKRARIAAIISDKFGSSPILSGMVQRPNKI